MKRTSHQKKSRAHQSAGIDAVHCREMGFSDEFIDSFIRSKRYNNIEHGGLFQKFVPCAFQSRKFVDVVLVS